MLTRALKNNPAVAALISELEQVRLERDEATAQLKSNLNETNFEILWELDHINQERDQYLWERDEATIYSDELQNKLQALKEDYKSLDEECDRLYFELKYEQSTAYEYKVRMFNNCNRQVISIPAEYCSEGKDDENRVRLMEEDIVNLLKNRKELNQESEILREEVNCLLRKGEQAENLYLKCAVCLNFVNVKGTGFSMSNCQHAVCTICSRRCNVCPICREKTNYTKIIFN